jgi:hypothetical protein
MEAPPRPPKMAETSLHAETVQTGTKLEVSELGLNEANLPTYHDKKTVHVLRKIDWRLLPMLTLLYILSFLDRGNIGNARVAGMNKELKLTDKQYNLALTVRARLTVSAVYLPNHVTQILFIPYAIFEVPSNIVLKVVRPSTWMTILVVSWGIVRRTLDNILRHVC